jgi:hypothetical protein
MQTIAGFAHRNYVAAIVVAQLEKGIGLKAGDIIHARYKWTMRLSSGP